MTQPIIGITTAIDDAGEMYNGRVITYITRDYAKIVRELGGQPVLLDPAIDPDVAATLCDGVIISGGDDIDPALYGQESRVATHKATRLRSDWERRLIDACDAFERPVLGICYGMQLLNVHYGGTLFQDIKDERGTDLYHGSPKQHARQDVTFTADFLGYKKGQRVSGTHIHHQAVNQVAPGFSVVAHADDDGIEAIVGHGHFGVQWHAELDATSAGIYGEFIQRCQPQLAKARAKSLSRFLLRFSRKAALEGGV